MKSLRVLDKPEDYKRFGLNPDMIEKWEDGRRAKPDEHLMENWYFDANMEDGTKVVLSFRTSSPQQLNVAAANIEGSKDSPNLNIHITTPEGITYDKFVNCPPEESETRTGECYLKYGPHYFKGNLKDYDIKVSPVDGLGVDLHFKTTVAPFRPGTGYIQLEDNDGGFMNHTWFCFPRGEVTGNVTVQDVTYEVKGVGYHDHQWSSDNPILCWHHWLWGRQNTGDYTVAISDLVATEAYGFVQVPLIGIYDKSGKLIFQTTSTKETKTEIIERYYEEQTQKYYPKEIRYTLENAQKRIVYTIRWTQELEVRTPEKLMIDANPKMKAVFDKLGISPSYIRYAAKGDLQITENGKTQGGTGDVIYEFAYFGKPDDRANL